MSAPSRCPEPQGRWADLPLDLLLRIFDLAASPPPLPSPVATDTAAVSAGLPSLRQAACLRYAIEGCCQSWRAAAAGMAPLRVALRTMVPTNAVPALAAWLCRCHVSALHVEPVPLPRNGKGRWAACERLRWTHYSQARTALALLSLEQMAVGAGARHSPASVARRPVSRPPAAAPPTDAPLATRRRAGPTLTNLALLSGSCADTLQQLPRFTALTRLDLKSMRYGAFDEAPLHQLTRLVALHVDPGGGAPRLDHLPAGLRHLSLTCHNSLRRACVCACCASWPGRAGWAWLPPAAHCGRSAAPSQSAAAAASCCRVLLPQHLWLDSLTVCSATYAVVGLSRAMALCRGVFIHAPSLSLLLKQARCCCTCQLCCAAAAARPQVAWRACTTRVAVRMPCLYPADQGGASAPAG